MIQHGIRTRLTLIFISLAIIPLVALSFFIGWRSLDTEKQHAADKVRETARWVGTEVNSHIKVIATHLQMLVSVRGLADITPQDRKEMLEEMLAFHPEFETLSYLNGKGMELLRVSKTEASQQQHLIDRSSTDEFLRVAATGTTYYGPVTFSEKTGEPFMTIAEPVLDPRSNTLFGVLSARVSIKRVWDIIAALQLKPGEDVYILDIHGRVVAHRNPSVVLRETRANIPAPALQGILATSTTQGLNGKTAIYSSYRIPLGERSLHVIAEQSTDEAFHLAYGQMKIFLGATLITLLAAVLLFVIVTGTIIRPLQHLAAVARDIMAGNLDSRAEINRDDELGELAATFNQMTLQLRKSLEELYQEIRQRDQAQKDLQKELQINTSLSSLANRLLTMSDIQEIARLILEQAQSLTRSPHGFISLISVGEEQTKPVLTEITNAPCPAEKPQPFAGHPLQPDRVFHNVSTGAATHEKGLPPGHIPLARILRAPVFVGNDLVGQIILAGAEKDYRENDVALVERLAALFAIAISRFQAMAEKETLQGALRQAQKMEAIGTLAGGIAHDFNNILTPILGYAELIQAQHPADSETGNDISEIVKATKRAIDLVGQILTFSRRKEQKLQYVTLQPILKETLKLLRATIPTSIEIRHKIAPECGSVLADPTQIHQIIMNLCTNSFHAMQEKGGILTLSLQPVTLGPNNLAGKPSLAPGNYLCLEVSDTGSGMRHDIVERIFEPYFSTKSEGKGTGLGLSVVLGIVKGHGGEITVDSKPGSGTSFRVFLPQAAHQPEKALRMEGEEFNNFAGHGHILLVDDEAAVLNLEKKILIGLGYEVSATSKSEEALSMFRREPEKFDLLITDMTMPRMSGTELAKSVLKDRPDLPIIICTGYSELITAEQAQEIGIREYIAKPVTLKNFASTIHNVLHRQRGDATRAEVELPSR